MIKICALVAALAAVGVLLVQPAFAAPVPGRGNFGGGNSTTYTCKSGKTVQKKKACKEFGGKY